jgi:chorismate mutase
MTIRGIRGATDVPENSAAAIDRCTQELLRAVENVVKEYRARSRSLVAHQKRVRRRRMTRMVGRGTS